MNIESLKLSDSAVMRVINPLTGEFEGATIEIYNRYSDAYRSAKVVKDLTSISNNILDLSVAITKEIKGFKDGDRELTSSKEDIKYLYENCPFLLDDIDKFFSDNSNFFLKA